MVERFSVLLPSYKCRRENHENCNNVFGVNLRELFEKAKNAGYVCIGVCKEPEYSKPDCWGLVFEDAATFESFWYHCWNFNAERLYAEARVRTGKETDKDVIEYVERWSEE